MKSGPVRSARLLFPERRTKSRSLGERLSFRHCGELESNQQFSMPAGRVAALVPEPVDELVELPAEPAVLPAEPDGVEPTVLPLLALPEAIEPGA
jgi:hypothetical protein